jgi:RNA polymerase primary sigma factor
MSTTVTTEQIQAAQAGDQDAMWEIISAYEPMMWRIIRTTAPGATREQNDDLIQEARAVLLQNTRSYDTEASAATLATYAYNAIRRAVAEEWLGSTTQLSVDASAALRVRRALWDTEGDVEGAWMIVSSDTDPRRRMSREAFVAIREAIAETQCLDAPQDVVRGAVGEDGSILLSDLIPDASSDFTDTTARRDLARWLLTEIPQRQAFALRAFYGIGMQRLTEDEASADLQVKKAPLRVLRTRGIDNARAVAGRHNIAA